MDREESLPSRSAGLDGDAGDSNGGSFARG